MAKKPTKWMQKTKNKATEGSLRAAAKRRGLIKGNEKLTASDLSTLSKSKSKLTRKRANLAKVYAAVRKS
jgi:hypothetical protein